MVHVHLSLVTATEALMTIMYKSLSECTVVAAYNLLMQVLPTIEMYGEIFGEAIS